MKVIKKYANRRLYDTAQSAYITLSDLAVMVADGCQVTISDAKTGDDLTAATLLQILIEKQQAGSQSLSAHTLAQIISHDNEETGLALCAYLEEAMEQFSQQQQADDDSAQNDAQIAEMREALLRLNTAFNRFQR